MLEKGYCYSLRVHDLLKLKILFTIHVYQTLLDETMTEARSIKSKNNNFILVYFDATSNNNLLFLM